MTWQAPKINPIAASDWGWSKQKATSYRLSEELYTIVTKSTDHIDIRYAVIEETTKSIQETLKGAELFSMTKRFERSKELKKTIRDEFTTLNQQEFSSEQELYNGREDEHIGWLMEVMRTIEGEYASLSNDFFTMVADNGVTDIENAHHYEDVKASIESLEDESKRELLIHMWDIIQTYKKFLRKLGKSTVSAVQEVVVKNWDKEKEPPLLLEAHEETNKNKSDKKQSKRGNEWAVERKKATKKKPDAAYEAIPWRDIDHVVTEQWSTYKYLDNGTTQRYKKKIESLRSPKDLLVYLPNRERIQQHAPQSIIDMMNNESQYSWIIQSYIHNPTSLCSIVDENGNALYTNNQIFWAEQQGKQVFVSFWSGKNLACIIPVQHSPRIWFSTLDMGKTRDPQTEKTSYSRHLWHKVTEIIKKEEKPKVEKPVLPTWAEQKEMTETIMKDRSMNYIVAHTVMYDNNNKSLLHPHYTQLHGYITKNIDSQSSSEKPYLLVLQRHDNRKINQYDKQSLQAIWWTGFRLKNALWNKTPNKVFVPLSLDDMKQAQSSIRVRHDENYLNKQKNKRWEKVKPVVGENEPYERVSDDKLPTTHTQVVSIEDIQISSDKKKQPYVVSLQLKTVNKETNEEKYISLKCRVYNFRDNNGTQEDLYKLSLQASNNEKPYFTDTEKEFARYLGFTQRFDENKKYIGIRMHKKQLENLVPCLYYVQRNQKDDRSKHQKTIYPQLLPQDYTKEMSEISEMKDWWIYLLHWQWEDDNNSQKGFSLPVKYRTYKQEWITYHVLIPRKKNPQVADKEILETDSSKENTIDDRWTKRKCMMYTENNFIEEILPYLFDKSLAWDISKTEKLKEKSDSSVQKMLGIDSYESIAQFSSKQLEWLFGNVLSHVNNYLWAQEKIEGFPKKYATLEIIHKQEKKFLQKAMKNADSAKKIFESIVGKYMNQIQWQWITRTYKNWFDKRKQQYKELLDNEWYQKALPIAIEKITIPTQ